MVKNLFFMPQVPSILAEVTNFNFLEAATFKVEFLGTDGYLVNLSLILGCLVVNLDEWCLEGK